MKTIEREPAVEEATEFGTRIFLPTAPETEVEEVKAWEEPVELVSYLPGAPDRNPMFLDRRVYQGSSEEVYPLPLTDRVATEPILKLWKAIHIENRYVRLMILPEIGGRIHVGLDKVNGYDFFDRQNVIKPALVGLAGPWISGGVEFNWPQHHRPAAFMPVETEIERHQDGSVTVWCSDYDRASGMKGMHGICLHPSRAVVELKARLYNGTETTQTFLWWASVAAKVHQDYQSFFPPDVRHVADHAARAKQGVSKGETPACFQRAKAGFVHVANGHTALGKKQWTLGDHEFGYEWDRSHTDSDGPYVGLMAGVYTDNQPDFSFLVPGETKTFSQFWYPLRNLGVPLAANLDAAIRVEANDDMASVSVCVTRDLPDAIVMLKHASHLLALWEQDLTVETGFAATMPLPAGCDTTLLSLELRTETGQVLNCSLAPLLEREAPATAVEPDLPEAIGSLDELFLTGLHLEQYRHATRLPEPYWREALRRDPKDVRCNHALAKLHLKRGEYPLAEDCVRVAISRATRLNGNPHDGEIFYTLGLVLRRLGRTDEAYAAFYKATWNAAWRSAGYFEVAQIDALRGELDTAVQHLELSLRTDADNLNARNLCAALLRRLDRDDEASDLLAHTSDLDRLDLWSRFLDGVDLPQSGHQLLSLGLLMERSGQFEDAIQVCKEAVRIASDGSAPLLHLAIARCSASLDLQSQEKKHLAAARTAAPDYCFPNGLDHYDLLQYGIARRPEAARLHYYLGNLLFHYRRHEEAIASWQRSAHLDGSSSQVWRNLGIGHFNILHDSAAALQAFDRARLVAPWDARLVYEQDQLRKRLGTAPGERLEGLLEARSLVETRDDLSVELATLLNQLDRPEEALEVLLSRQFQPWEGGEGLVLAQYTAAHLKLGEAELCTPRLPGAPDRAIAHFHAALNPPRSLGEARHLLANCSNVYFWLGEALTAGQDATAATCMYERSASWLSDFQGMAVQKFSEMTYWSGLALRRLGREEEAKSVFQAMLHYATELEARPATIDYFATSLPSLLLFDEDLVERQRANATGLRTLALKGLAVVCEPCGGGDLISSSKAGPEIGLGDDCMALSGQLRRFQPQQHPAELRGC